MGFMDYLSDLYDSLTIQSAEAEEKQQDDDSGTYEKGRARECWRFSSASSALLRYISW